MRQVIKDVDFAVDEHIWGHRLYDEQLPHLTILEFLTVFASNLSAPFELNQSGSARYKPQRQIRLRGLLFNNPYVETIRTKQLPNIEKWKQWEELFLSDSTILGDDDLSYLSKTFESFDDFAKAIELLRSSAFEGHSNKRWSSKFVFPFGPDALYEDLRFEASGAAANDRRFFARTGELLYLMLARSKGGSKLGAVIADRVFNNSAPMNKLVKALQGETQFAQNDKEVGYLPHSTHSRFDILCEDWLEILSRDLPVYDALEHLISITGLNLLLYFLECAKMELGDVEPVQIVCEIIKERSKVRALSGDSYQTNQALSMRAIRASIENIRSTEEWGIASKSDNPVGACSDMLRVRHQWPSPEEESKISTPDDLLKKFIEMAESRHQQHIGKIHASWARAVGLSSRYQSRRNRYAPSDSLLKTLVITVVKDRMQFDEFLSEIRHRYGLVIGDAEGEWLIMEKKVDQEALSENRLNLENRLVGLGLVRRLSDSCSFVENPFISQEVANVD